MVTLIDRIRDGLAAYRHRSTTFRVIGGVSMVAVALALTLGAAGVLQRAVPDATTANPPAGNTPETYFAYVRSTNYQGDAALTWTKGTDFALPAMQRQDTYSLGGRWAVEPQYIQGIPGSTLRLAYRAKDVYLVLGGTGAIQVDTSEGTKTIQVQGAPARYPIVSTPLRGLGQLTVTTLGSVRFYTATFG